MNAQYSNRQLSPASSRMNRHANELLAAMARAIYNTIGDLTGKTLPAADIETVRSLSEELHTEARAGLMNSASAEANTRQIQMFRVVEDVRVAMSALQTAARSLTLLKDRDDSFAVTVSAPSEFIVDEIAQRTKAFATNTARALIQGDTQRAAHEAAVAVREIRQLFAAADAQLGKIHVAWSKPEMADGPFQVVGSRCRIVRSALWSLMICAENIARVAARFTVSLEEPITATGQTATNSNAFLNPLVPTMARQPQTAYAYAR